MKRCMYTTGQDATDSLILEYYNKSLKGHVRVNILSNYKYVHVICIYILCIL